MVLDQDFGQWTVRSWVRFPQAVLYFSFFTFFQFFFFQVGIACGFLWVLIWIIIHIKTQKYAKTRKNGWLMAKLGLSSGHGGKRTGAGRKKGTTLKKKRGGGSGSGSGRGIISSYFKSQPSSEMSKKKGGCNQQNDQLERAVSAIVSTLAIQLEPQLKQGFSQLQDQIAGLQKQVRQLQSEVKVEAKAKTESIVESKTEAKLKEFEFKATLANGNIICLACSMHCKIVCTTGSQKSSPWLLKNGGVNGDDARINKRIERHFVDSAFHQEAVTMEHTRLRSRIQKGIGEIKAEARNQMAKLFRTVLYLAQRNHSLTEYEYLVNLQFENSGNVGGAEHSRETCREMVLYTEKWLRSQQIKFINTKNPSTGRLPHVGSKADKMTDPTTMKKQHEIVTVRVNYLGELNAMIEVLILIPSYLYRLSTVHAEKYRESER